VIELASIGPGPFAAMLLADMGATVVRVDRTREVDLGLNLPPRASVLNRGRRSVALDLRTPGGVDVLLRLVETADALLEGHRPGVAERLGVGPEACLARNPRLVYGRMTGYGQDGPLAGAAGHDIDFLALAGVLGALGGAERPVPPLNLVADFGGGGMLLAFGVLCGLLEARRSGRGQVVDAAMVEGVALLANMVNGLRALGEWSGERGTNVLDGGAHFYGTYATSDGGHVAVGALEKAFYRRWLQGMGLDPAEFEPQMDRARWPAWRARIAALFLTRTRDEWIALLGPADCCVTPVLDPDEAAAHPHNRARGTFVEHGGILQAAPAPRFARTPGGLGLPPPLPGEHTDALLAEAGYAPEEIAALRAAGAVR